MQPKNIIGIGSVAALGLFTFSAQAARLGHPGVSASQGRGGPTQWALISDPSGATDGRTSTLYDAGNTGGEQSALYGGNLKVAELVEVIPEKPYSITSIEVGLTNGTFAEFFPDAAGDVFINHSQFGPYVMESGVVQVSWSLLGAPPSSNTKDDNTHELLFEPQSKNAKGGSKSTFTDTMLYYGSYPGQPSPDYYEGLLNNKPFYYTTDPNDDTPGHTFVPSGSVGQTITLKLPPSPIDHAAAEVAQVVSSALPEPSMLGLGGFVTMMGLLRRRRRA
jgi:hypothetical protein